MTRKALADDGGGGRGCDERARSRRSVKRRNLQRPRTKGTDRHELQAKPAWEPSLGCPGLCWASPARRYPFHEPDGCARRAPKRSRSTSSSCGPQRAQVVLLRVVVSRGEITRQYTVSGIDR